MTRRLYRISHWCATHAKTVLALWLLVLITVAGLNNRLAPAGQQDVVLPGTDSAQAQTLLGRAFPGVSSDAQPLVLACKTPLDSGQGADTIKRVEQAEKQVIGVADVTGPDTDASLLAPDKETAILQIQVGTAYIGKEEVAEEVLQTGIDNAPDCEVALGGLMGESLSQSDSRLSEGLGLIMAVFVLLFTLRRFMAAFVPLVNAIVTVGIGTALIGLLSRAVFIPDVAPILGTMLGLGVGIDYALFLIIRHRALLRSGFEVYDSIGRTSGTAGAGMVFAGSTLILALGGLALTRISFLTWLGLSAAIVIAVAIAASLTFVPAVFGLLGKRVMPKVHRGRHSEDGSHLDHGFWARIADSVTAKPWRHAIAATGILLLLALPMTQMSFGQTDASALPKDTTAYQANELISDAFGPGQNGPLAVVVQLNKPAQAPKDTSDIPSGTDPRSYDPRLLSLEDDLRESAGVDQVGDAVVSADAGVAVISVIPTTSPADPATQELVDELRTTVLPAATNGQDEEAYVGGSTALMMDLSDEIAAALPIFIGGVVLLSGSLLLLAYRSLVIPIKAAAMNLLSICAAYGVVVAVFQFGWGASLLGLDELVPIESYVPMMMFAVLFGLSMDYEVFLLTSFREHWTRTGDMVASVRRGLADTGEVVTAAASIMVVVFAAFILVPGAVVKMFGVGLATAVLVDATIVRCVLVPALMVLAAKATWWLPKWLDRSLPELHVEGDPASLESIHEPLPDDRPSTVAEATAPTVGLVWAAIAGLVSWWICTNTLEAGTTDPFLPLAVTISAIVGSLVVWLPRGVPGSGRGPAVRVVMLVLGGGFVAAVFALLAALIPFTQRNQGMMAAWGLVLLALFAAYTPARKYGLPLILGGIVTGVALALVDLTTIGQGNVLQVTVLPLLLSGFLAITLNRLARTLPSPPEDDDEGDAGDPPAPSAPAEKVGASS